MITSSKMIDIETLGTQPNAAILAISAVAFDPFEITTDFSLNPKFDVLIDLESQPNREISEETLEWWSKQSPITRDKIFSDENRISLKEALEQLTKFVWNTTSKIWVQGVSLDIPVLDHAFNEQKISVPWGYHQIRDSRTLLDLVFVEQPPVSHDSIDDCYRQIIGVQKALQKLGITQFVRK